MSNLLFLSSSTSAVLVAGAHLPSRTDNGGTATLSYFESFKHSLDSFNSEFRPPNFEFKQNFDFVEPIL